MRSVPRPFPFPDVDRRGTILVVGAGAAGLSAAYHLRNFGFQVSGHTQSAEESSVGPHRACSVGPHGGACSVGPHGRHAVWVLTGGMQCGSSRAACSVGPYGGACSVGPHSLENTQTPL